MHFFLSSTFSRSTWLFAGLFLAINIGGCEGCSPDPVDTEDAGGALCVIDSDCGSGFCVDST